ncbi:MAG: hypothetical protein O3A47_08460, partial [Chloroflexi bacterium]|nr:hypothetical protein [Chloroflexota bacterium]
MKRKRWFIVSIMGAVMALGITSGVVMAQEATDPDGDSPIRGLAARVADVSNQQKWDSLEVERSGA